jgi:anti-sigma-K factor RskA
MTDHQWLDSAAPYALGALAQEERGAFEAHLAGCEVCRAEVRSFVEVAGLLAHSAPAAEPPPELRDRVMAEARRVRSIGARRRGPSGGWLAAAAAAVVAVGAGGYAWRLSSRVSTLEARIAQADAEAAVADSVIRALTGPQIHVVSLAGTGREPTARVFWNHTTGRFIVFAFDLPPAYTGRIYQLWAIAKGKPPMSMGVFNTDSLGRAALVLPVDPQITALGFIDNCGLTEEPAGGSPQPTETPRLLGAWRHTD